MRQKGQCRHPNNFVNVCRVDEYIINYTTIPVDSCYVIIVDFRSVQDCK